jgi:hypothetical protein
MIPTVTEHFNQTKGDGTFTIKVEHVVLGSPLPYRIVKVDHATNDRTSYGPWFNDLDHALVNAKRMLGIRDETITEQLLQE